LSCDQNLVEKLTCPMLRSELQSKHGYPASKLRAIRKADLVDLVLKERQNAA